MIAALRDRLPTLVGMSLAGSRVRVADDFSYTDPVDGTLSHAQGLRIILADGSRIVARLSGTGTEGATLRVYLERYRREEIEQSIDAALAPLVQAASQVLDLRTYCGTERATIIT